jgi:hypothetical protein
MRSEGGVNRWGEGVYLCRNRIRGKVRMVGERRGWVTESSDISDTSSVSTSVVFPDPAAPTSNTLRTASGRSATGTSALPFPPEACLVI